MESANVPPKPNTTRSIVNKLTQNNSPRDIEAAYEILLAQRKLKNSVHIAALNTIIAAFVRISDVKSAFNVYKVIPNFDLRPDLQTFNWLLRGAAEQGRKKFAMWVVAEMQEMGIKPGEETYESLVLVCAAQEVINDAFAYLEEMKNMRFKPSARLYEALAVRCWELKDWRFEGVVKEMEEKGYSARGIVEMSHQRKAGEQAAVRAQGVQRVRAQEDEEGEGLQRDPADKVGEQLGRKLRW
jgi:pentatricopeptide repeat protein